MPGRPIRKGVAGLAAGLVLPHACAIAGAVAGLFAGYFAAAAGLVIGGMLDVARSEARARGRVSAYLEDPEKEAPPEPVEGYAAAACVALRGDWPGLRDRGARRALWQRFSEAALPHDGRGGREAERIADVAERCALADLPALARRLAASEDPRARGILADWAFALAALGGARLEPGPELVLRAALGDCGVGARGMLAARLRAFPGGRDPWTVLGLSPGAPRAEVKRAYRRLSRLFHPDASPGDDGDRFRELRDAYAELSSSSGD